MNKYQALQNFWSSFALPAYDENSVPTDPMFPYITYSVQTDSLDSPVLMTASLWYRTYSWEGISMKTEEIARRIVEMDPIPLDNRQYLYLTKGVPFAQRMNDPSDDAIRRVYLNIMAEYLTAY